MRGEVPEGWYELQADRASVALHLVAHRVGARLMATVRYESDRWTTPCAAPWAVHVTDAAWWLRYDSEGTSLLTTLLWLQDGPSARRDRVCTLARLGGVHAVAAYLQALSALTP